MKRSLTWTMKVQDHGNYVNRNRKPPDNTYKNYKLRLARDEKLNRHKLCAGIKGLIDKPSSPYGAEAAR